MSSPNHRSGDGMLQSLRAHSLIDVRPSPIAGTWYPGDPVVLAESVDRLLSQAKTDPTSGSIVAVIVPHAGHRYSGHVAAHGFALLAGSQTDLVAIVSPFHGPHPGQVLTTAHGAYRTPLGDVPVDLEALRRFELELRTASGLPLTRIRDDGEHSLEIELPFLQRVLPLPFPILPIMLRDQSRATAEAVARALAACLAGRRALLVASSDLSHHQPARVARRLDGALLDRIESFDPAGVLSAEDEGKGYACGKAAIAAVLWAARDLGATSARVLKYAHSGEVTGDDTAVVGYGAAAVYRMKEG
ncbi:MAG TPA: AmmeMemoRadiSam system protein B, partial [Anaerolineales bacterium]